VADQDVQSNVVLTADTSQYNQAMAGSAQQTDALSASVDSLGAKLDKLAKSAGRKLLGVSAADTAVIVGATAAYAAWEKQMTSLNVQAAVLSRTLGDGRRQFDEYGRQVNSLRRDFAQSTSEAAQLVQTISKMSDQTAPVTQLERSFGKLGAAMGESSSSLAASMLQLQRTMGTSQRDTNMFNNQLTVLQARSNAAASSILSFANSIAPVARVANISQTDIMGMSNAFIKAGQDGYQAANVVTRMLTDITQATVSGSPELAKYANLVGMTTQQFKELGGTGQITQIFDAINRQGPQAITTLNRMGLDGLRTVRTITAMAQQGGLAGEIAAARSADPNAMNRGSQAALSGITDSMRKLRIEMTQTAEDFGSAFAKPAKYFFDSMTMIAKAVHAVVDSPFGKMAALVVGVTAPFAALAGTILMAAKALTAFAAINQVVRGGLISGVREGRGIPFAEQQALMASGTALGPQGRNVMERGSWTNRAFYNTGRQLGSFLPARGEGPGLMSRGAGAIMAGTGGLARMTGNMLYGAGAMRMPFTPNSGGYNDITRRWNMFTAPTFGESMKPITGFMGSIRAGFTGSVLSRMPTGPDEEDIQRRMQRMAGSRLAGLSSDAERRAAAEREATLHARTATAMGNLERATRGASQGAMTLGRGLGNLSMMMAGTAGGAMRDAGKLAGRGLGAIGLNPWMLGIMGGVAGLSMLGRMNQSSANTQMVNTSNFGGAYFQAGGISAPPTANISYARQRPAVTSIGAALSVTPADIAYAKSDSHKLTNSALKGLSKDQALARLGIQWQTLRQSPEAINAVKLDLIDKFGETQANQMLKQLDSGKLPGLTDLAHQASVGTAHFGALSSGKASSKALDQYYGALNDLTDVTYQTSGAQAAAQTRGRGIAEGYAAFAGGDVSTPERRSFEHQFMKNVLGLKNVNYQGENGAFGGIFDTGGTIEQAGYSKNLKGYITDLATRGALSNDNNRKDVAERYGIDYKGMSDKQFATALYNTIKNGPDYKKWESTQETTQDLLKDASANLFGVSGILGNRAVQTALTNTGDVNAQYAAINEIQRKTSGQGIRAQFAALTGMQQVAGGDDSMGAGLIGGGLTIAQRNLGYQMPYMTRPQQFGAVTAQTQGVLDTVRAKGFSGGFTQENLDTQMASLQQSTQEQYNYFKQMLYQQREFNVSRQRAEDDFNTQRQYALTDFDLQRSRSEHDFQLQRKRAEADYALSVSRNRYQFNLQRDREEKDHQHQVMLMVEQQAKAMYSMYERVNVQRTNSARWILVNANDQLQRMQKQEAQLGQLRKMGLSDDAIQQLNLTDSSNQQQLSRFVTEVAADPNLVKSFNDAVKTRLAAARDLVTDESSTDWQEFQRSYNLSRSRAADDFELSMKQSREDFKKSLSRQDTDFQTSLHRQQHDFNTSMDRQRDQYNLSMQRAADDLARSAKTIDGNFEEILTKAVNKLGGHAKKQAQTVLDQFNALKDSTTGASTDIMTALAAIFGIEWTPPKAKAISNQAAKNRAEIMDVHQAAGGVLPGYTPGQDVHHFYSPTAGNLHLSGGEAIMVPEWTRMVGGEKAVAEMNKAARTGMRMAFRDGGVIPQPRLDEAKRFAKAQVGDPYVWGGVGPNGYDCSGFMSALTNVLLGNNPYHRFGSTASFPWPGFAPGVGQFTIGSTKHYPGSSVGHMAGTLDGMNVESRGGHGVIVGPGARGYRDPGFTTVYHLGGAGDFGYSAGGADVGTVRSLRSILHDSYPKVEAAAAGIVPHILGVGDASAIINKMARRRYRQLKKSGFGDSPDSTAGASPIPAGPSDATSPEADVRIAASHYGWMPSQWRALSKIVSHESGFNPNAQNPTSTAYGMFQFLDSTWASVGGHKTADPYLQAVYGTKYIKERYGNPNKAWDFWQAHHWYGDGAVFSGAQTIGVGERGPEAVIPLNDRGADFMTNLMSKYGSGNAGRALNVRGSQPIYISNQNTYHIDRSTTFSGAITVQADNPGQLIAALQQRQRMMAMANPALGGVKV